MRVSERRAKLAWAIPSGSKVSEANIAEGSAKPSDAEFAHFLDTALGSAYEVETQLLIAAKVGYIDGEKYNELHNWIIEIEKQLSGLIKSIRK